MYLHFNHSQFRRYLVAFGTLFNNIVITRDDPNGAEVQRMVIPIEYGPKERWLRRLIQDPSLQRSVSAILPRMAFEIDSVSLDTSRALNTQNKLTFPSGETGKLARTYVGVPYILSFSLHLMVKYQQDGLQVVEQIIPYFTPDLVFAMKPVPTLDIVDQIPVSLTSITHSDNYEGDFEHRRAIVWTFTFSMKVNFYGPRRSGSRIEEIMVDLYNSPFILNDPDDEAGLAATIDVVADPREGQDPTANGYPAANTTITEY